MAAATVFAAYLGEIEASIRFFRLATYLRPRLGPYVNWSVAGSEEKKLFQEFLNGAPIEERIYQAALVSVCAGLEQFVADLLEELCETINSRRLSASEVDRLFPGALMKQRRYAGLPLDRINEPRPHWRLLYDDLISSLATTAVGSPIVKLYGRAFAINVGSIDVASIEKAFERLSLTVPWSEICKARGLQKGLGTAAQAETREALTRTLSRMVEIRNSLAHSQGSDVIGYEELVGWVTVAKELSQELAARLLQAARGTT